MTETSPDQPPEIIPVDVAVGEQTVSVEPTQVFIYSPAITDNMNPRTARVMQRAAEMVQREAARVADLGEQRNWNRNGPRRPPTVQPLVFIPTGPVAP